MVRLLLTFASRPQIIIFRGFSEVYTSQADLGIQKILDYLLTEIYNYI